MSTITLDELLAENFTERPSKPFKVVIGKGQQLVPEIMELDSELADIKAAQRIAEQKPRKAGESTETPQRVTEIHERMAELLEEMRRYEGTLTITATKSDGDWAKWKIEHPAREGGEPGSRDDFITSGLCNADALLEDLATYVTHWEGQPLGDGHFDRLNVLRPDKKAIAALVVNLYEEGDNLPKLRSNLSAALASERSSSSPATSASARNGSTGGSPRRRTSTSTPEGN